MENLIKRFMEPEEIAAKNKLIISLLKENKLTEAEEVYNKIKYYNNPYDTEVEYGLALAYAKKRAFKKSSLHLTLAYDIIDSFSFFKKAEKNEVFKDMPSDLMDDILINELNWKWNDIWFHQIYPSYNKENVQLIIREEYQNEIVNISTIFSESVHQGAFEIFAKNNPTGKVYFDVAFNYDKKYVSCEEILFDIKQISPYVEDCRFFMVSKSKNYIDEVLIHNRKFYVYRHFCENTYEETKIEDIENIDMTNPSYSYLKNYLSKIWGIHF